MPTQHQQPRRHAIVVAGAAAASLAILLASGPVRAQERQGPTVSASVTVASDYIVRGVSQTEEEGALIGTVDVTWGAFYAGGFAANVAFPGDPDTRVEVDLYGGVRREVAGFNVDVGIVAYIYDDPADLDYDFVELKAAVSRAVGPITFAAAVLHSPDFLGASEDEATYIEGQVSFAAGERWTVSTAIGSQIVSSAFDYNNWNVGAAYAFTDHLALDVRYHATDARGFGDIYGDRIVASLRTAF